MKTLLHLRKAFGHSMKGLRETFRNEMAFRIELTAAVILIPTALILSVFTDCPDYAGQFSFSGINFRIT